MEILSNKLRRLMPLSEKLNNRKAKKEAKKKRNPRYNYSNGKIRLKTFSEIMLENSQNS